MSINQRKIIDSEKFKRFFFYGIENKREVKDGILYFSTNKIYKRHSLKEWYSISNEQFETEMMEEAIKKYRQFYRFVTLNDIRNSSTFIVDDRVLKEELEEELKLLKEEGRIISTMAGIFFTRNISVSLEGNQHFDYGEGLKGEEGWTSQIYKILEQLEKIEKEDSAEYYKYWILTKFARAVNRFDNEEALKVKIIYESLQKDEKEKGGR